ncbi:SpoIIAA family protein [Aquibacillus rhizosphaerae]|uniref:STAS/SEC14 domain-containing protein n=1 Tax=Aquibacillus rhizosphaerae TaxID=3051431 RepID=A0ABT7LB84_9BACI|nr:STAS/SEC14 domain-containing protein [Aquibacillus sp. LR5S19]MDL4843116.1 STAS/SEC14 domain-containing protein [Aquibacillus sp. LR5S19]
MLSVKQNPLDMVFEINVDGKITSSDMEKFKSHFKRQKEMHEKVNLLLVIHDIKGYSFQNLMDDLKFEANNWKEFGKIAVLSDKKSIATATKIGGYLPKINMKHFDMNERNQATDWLIK